VLTFNPRKGKVEMMELTEFCRRVTAIQGNEETWYLRIREGAARKSAAVIASGIPCTGVKAMTLEREIEERIRASGAEGNVWVEAMREGSSQIKDTVKIVQEEEEDQVYGTSLESSVHSLTQALVAITIREQQRGENLFQHLTEAQGAFLMTHQEYAKTLARLEAGGESDMTQALGMLAPLIPAIAGRLGDSGEQPQIPGGVDEHADMLVGAVVQLAKDHPEVITPQRLAQLASVLQS